MKIQKAKIAFYACILLLYTGAGYAGSASNNALHEAAKRGDLAAVEALIGAGADVRATDCLELTPLHVAVKGGHCAIVQVLLEAGADVNALGFGGMRPLCAAVVKEDHGAIVRLLLNAGAPIDGAINDRLTPLHRAAVKGCAATAQLLAACGAAPLTWAARERIISRSPLEGEILRERLERIGPLTERASLERKRAIESTLDAIKVGHERLPMDLQKLIIAMSEGLELTKWWDRRVKFDRLSAKLHASSD